VELCPPAYTVSTHRLRDTGASLEGTDGHALGASQSPLWNRFHVDPRGPRRVERDVKAVHGDVTALLKAGVLSRARWAHRVSVRRCDSRVPAAIDISRRRPASHKGFNRMQYIPFHESIPEGQDVTGFVMVEQVTSIDFRSTPALST
jgi:hypothetical protein